MLRQPRESAKEEIERFIQRGLAAITDNEAALVELGFARAHPNASGGFEEACGSVRSTTATARPVAACAAS